MRVMARASARRSPASTASASAASFGARAGRFASPAAFRSLALATGPFSARCSIPASYAGFATPRKNERWTWGNRGGGRQALPYNRVVGVGEQRPHSGEESCHGRVCRIGRIAERDIDLCRGRGRAVDRRGKGTDAPATIAAFLAKRAPAAERVGLESGGLSEWLHDGLQACGVPVICLDARQAHAKLSGHKLKKTDP